MTRRLASAALAVAAVLALAGCGSDAGPTAADDPAPTSAAGGGVPGSSGATPDSSPASVPQPQWPAIGCDSRSVTSVDYGRMPNGWKTPQEAVEHSPAGDIPAGVLTMAPSASEDQAKGPAQVWVVDPDTNEIQAQVSVFRGPGGWFVDGVMTCS